MLGDQRTAEELGRTFAQTTVRTSSGQSVLPVVDASRQIVVATPGRLSDHMKRRTVTMGSVKTVVLDEADRMLDMGFIPDIERIFQLTPFTRQTLFFSATMAPEIERITDTFLHSPERIEVARQATTSETITQKLVEITPKSIRLRKRFLKEHERRKAQREGEQA